MMIIVWLLAAVGAFLGGLLVLISFMFDGAPQQAAGAALGVGLAVAPYVFARAMQEMVALTGGNHAQDHVHPAPVDRQRGSTGEPDV